MIPRGMSRPGSLHSSAAVEIASNPMYAKKISEAPVQTPESPPGKKGCQFDGFVKKTPTPMKNSSVASFRTTITLLNRADSFTPMTRSQVMAAVMKTASRLQTTGMPKRTGWWRCASHATAASGPSEATPDSATALAARSVER